jgi:hypothetical protein
MTISISYDTSGSIDQKTYDKALHAVANHRLPTVTNRAQRRAEARKAS